MERSHLILSPPHLTLFFFFWGWFVCTRVIPSKLWKCTVSVQRFPGWNLNLFPNTNQHRLGSQHKKVSWTKLYPPMKTHQARLQGAQETTGISHVSCQSSQREEIWRGMEEAGCNLLWGNPLWHRGVISSMQLFCTPPPQEHISSKNYISYVLFKLADFLQALGDLPMAKWLLRAFQSTIT